MKHQIGLTDGEKFILVVLMLFNLCGLVIAFAAPTGRFWHALILVIVGDCLLVVALIVNIFRPDRFNRLIKFDEPRPMPSPESES